MDLTNTQRNALQAVAEEAQQYVGNLPHETDDLDVYVVGGAVRDALLGEPANDLDFVVINETVDTMLGRGFRDINASSFGVLHDANREEWALARTETKNGDGYKGIDVDTQGVSLREDLTRRDLCMNAMAVRLTDGTPTAFNEDEATPIETDHATAAFIDPFDGRKDLASGRIQHVSDAFSEDPIRVLRAARYAARFERPPDVPDALRDEVPDTVSFTIDGGTKQLMRRVAPELNRMSRDRIGEEIVKAMKQAKNPTRFWDVLRDTGALAVLVPKLDRASIVPAGPEKFHREGDTYTHTMMVLQQMHSICEDQNITGMDRVRRYMMVIAHDLGKVTLADKQGGLWSDDPPRKFGGHADAGVDDSERLADRVGLEGHVTEAMMDGAEHHMNIHDLPTWEPLELVEFVDNHDPAENAKKPYMATVEELIDLAQADHEGRFQNEEVFDGGDAFTMDEYAPDGAARPAFDRETFRDRVATARQAIKEINGYEILRTGLCSEHAATDPDESTLASQLGTCEDCRSPGPWVGERIAARRDEFITDTAA